MSAKRISAGRPTHLNRELIVGAALKLADDAGVENLSIRKVATRLGVTPMALYKYFSSKEELLSFALEAFIARANVIPDDDLPWEEWVRDMAHRMYIALCSDYSWVPVLGSVRLGAEAAQVTDAFVSKLTSVGFTVTQAVRAYFAVIQIVLGAVCLQASMRSADPAGKYGRELSRVTRAYLQQPSMQRLQVAPELDRVVRMEQIEIGLPLLVAALRRDLQSD